MIPEGLSSEEIDRAVRERTERGEAIYELDVEELSELEPDLIVTQALCEVCAVSYDDVRAIAEELPTQPRVLSLDPTTLGEVLNDVRRLAAETEDDEAGDWLLEDAAERIDRVREAVDGAEAVPVAALEWLAPPYVGGHWVPQMIELAGGVDVIGLPGEKSRTVSWNELRAAKPRVVVSMPCGYYAERAAQEVMDHRSEVESLGAERVVAVDAAAYFSRPGPRLVDGIELLAHILHPDRVESPPPERFIEIDVHARAG